jgi:tRNA1Val (adenine37-N6)-methyltransferase
MKVGTDSVILASWVQIENTKTVLDIGCGSGLLSIMLAQRISDADIIGVEIDADSAKDCEINIENAPWRERLKILRVDIRDYNPKVKFDMIISNPPFFTNSLLPPKDARARARHDSELHIEELLISVSRLLEREGVFAIVFPYLREKELLSEAEKYGLYPFRVLRTKNNPDAVLKRSFIAFRKHSNVQWEEEIMEIRNKQNVYSETYKELTKDFYLNF